MGVLVRFWRFADAAAAAAAAPASEAEDEFVEAVYRGAEARSVLHSFAVLSADAERRRGAEACASRPSTMASCPSSSASTSIVCCRCCWLDTTLLRAVLVAA